MNRSTWRRRATIWLVLLGYAAVASGLPLPFGGPSPAVEKRLASKDRSRPFPCMDKACGCGSAEQCFSNCCCNTPTELLAWARAHRIEPAVIASISRRLAAAPSTASCCSSRRSGCCVESPDHDSPAEPACCQAVARQDDRDAPAEEASPRSLSLRAMRACQGLAAEWFLLAASAPPPPVVVAMPSAEPCGRIVCLDVSSAGSLDAPEPPPPRRA